MKKTILFFALFISSLVQLSAHHIWIETADNAKIGSTHEVKIIFGEFNYDVVETVGEEAFNKVKDFTVWVINPAGEKEKLEAKPKDKHYSTQFTPKQKGIYTVYVDNDKIDVIDYTKYDFGIFKTHYQAVAKVNVGESKGATQLSHNQGIAFRNISEIDDSITMQVMYEGKKLAKAEVKIFLKNQWSKTVETDKEGQFTFGLPWNTKYVLEVTKKEEVPGTYKDEAYEFVWHCATYFLER